jgi:hypothetical protein
MANTHLNAILPPEDVHVFFVLEGPHLYRKLASGAAMPVKSMDANHAVTLFNGQRLRGVDIAWCLYYGNWPEFPVVQLGTDPLDFSRGNLYPARVKRLRYREIKKGPLYFHPLSNMGHISPGACRAHWEMMAAEFYRRDMVYVERVEAFERDLRAKYLLETGAVRKPVNVKTDFKKPSRPKAIEGREWHWVKDKWIDIPVAIHVCDDYRVRLAATLAGCTEFRFDPAEQRVFAYLPDGSRWTPAMQ